MALADRLERESAQHGSPCSVAVALQDLPPPDLEVFVELLGSEGRPGATAQYIYDVMQDERRDLMRQASAANEAGDRRKAADLQALASVYDVKRQTINRHRGNKCRCGRERA